MLGQILIVIGITAIVGFEIYAIVAVLRSHLEKKWRWVVVALIGVGELTFRWSTGEMLGLNPLSISLLGFGVHSYAGGPWVVDLALPAGAFAALYKARSAVALPTTANTEEVGRATSDLGA